MNTAIKIAIGFIAGAACGGAGVYFGLRKKFSEAAQAEINEYRDIARKRVQAADDYVAEKLNEKEAREYAEICNANCDFVDYTSYFKDHSEETVQVDVTGIKDELNALSKEVNDKDFDKHMSEREFPNEDDEDDDEPDWEEVSNEERLKIQERARVNNVPPYPIDEDDFMNERMWYSKICLTWYTGDGFLTDDQDDIMREEEIDTCLGGHEYEGWLEDSDICFVRNDALAIDYEICKVHTSFSEVYPNDTEVVSDSNGKLIAGENEYIAKDSKEGPVISIN